MPFQQRTNTSWRSIRPQPTVSRRLFRCLGAHLLRSPYLLKIGFSCLARRSPVYRHTCPVASRSSPALNSISRLTTSSRCLGSIAHSYSSPSICPSFTYSYAYKTKNPASISVSRVEKSFFNLLPAYLHSVRIGFRQLTLISNRQAGAKRTTGV